MVAGGSPSAITALAYGGAAAVGKGSVTSFKYAVTNAGIERQWSGGCLGAFASGFGWPELIAVLVKHQWVGIVGMGFLAKPGFHSWRS
jgi:hypothetical protein